MAQTLDPSGLSELEGELAELLTELDGLWVYGRFLVDKYAARSPDPAMLRIELEWFLQMAGDVRARYRRIFPSRTARLVRWVRVAWKGASS